MWTRHANSATVTAQKDTTIHDILMDIEIWYNIYKYLVTNVKENNIGYIEEENIQRTQDTKIENTQRAQDGEIKNIKRIQDSKVENIQRTQDTEIKSI